MYNHYYYYYTIFFNIIYKFVPLYHSKYFSPFLRGLRTALSIRGLYQSVFSLVYSFRGPRTELLQSTHYDLPCDRDDLNIRSSNHNLNVRDNLINLILHYRST